WHHVGGHRDVDEGLSQSARSAGGKSHRQDQPSHPRRRQGNDRVVVDEGGRARCGSPPSARADVLDDLGPHGFSTVRGASHVRARRPRRHPRRRRARGVVPRGHRGHRRVRAAARGFLAGRGRAGVHEGRQSRDVCLTLERAPRYVPGPVRLCAREVPGSAVVRGGRAMKKFGIVLALLAAVVILLPAPALAQVKGVYWTTSGFFGPFPITDLIPSVPKEKARDVTIPVSMWIIDHPKGLVVFDTGNNVAVSDGGCKQHWAAGNCDGLKPS